MSNRQKNCRQCCKKKICVLFSPKKRKKIRNLLSNGGIFLVFITNFSNECICYPQCYSNEVTGIILACLCKGSYATNTFFYASVMVTMLSIKFFASILVTKWPLLPLLVAVTTLTIIIYYILYYTVMLTTVYTWLSQSCGLRNTAHNERILERIFILRNFYSFKHTCLAAGATQYIKPAAKWKKLKSVVEMSGIEPEAFRMRNGRSTTELHPLPCHIYL